MKPQHLLLGWLAGVALLLQGCQSISNQKPPVPSPIAANRCALQTEGTTFKSLVESARGKKLKLVRVIRQEQSFPTLATDQWLEIDDDGKATASDGCNLFTFEPDHSPRQTDGNPFFQQFKPFTTLMACPENKSEFPLMSVYRYQQCGDEYWLYYDETAVEQPKIMVLAPSMETGTPSNPVSHEAQMGRSTIFDSMAVIYDGEAINNGGYSDGKRAKTEKHQNADRFNQQLSPANCHDQLHRACHTSFVICNDRCRSTY